MRGLLNSWSRVVSQPHMPHSRRDADLVSRIMSAVRSKNTEPELVLRRYLTRMARRFQYQPTRILGHPDFAFPPERVVVFVDGDFWHGRQWKLRGHRSLRVQFSTVRNRDYWIRKITRNIKRDARITRQLRRRGWKVVRLWEHDLKANPRGCLRRILRALEAGK